MPVQAAAEVLFVELPPERSEMYLQKYILHQHRYFILKTKKINSKIYFSIEQMRMNNLQRTSAI